MLSAAETVRMLNELSGEELLEFSEKYKNDSRKSVRAAAERAFKKYKKYIAEKERLFSISETERGLYNKGYKFIAGVDEVGRGPLAGPVVTAAVILKKDRLIEGVDDSKKLSEKKREELFGKIIGEAVSVSVTMEDNLVIDDINIFKATLRAMRRAVMGLEVKPDFVLVDAVSIPDLPMEQMGIIKGDAKSISIAAASIVAKVMRDRLMVSLAEVYPGYDFENNKGYGTKKHIEGLKLNGASPIHRLSFIKGII